MILVCAHCGTAWSETDDRCPDCGAHEAKKFQNLLQAKKAGTRPPLSHEHEIALREAHCIPRVDGYFEQFPGHTKRERRCYELGFTAGWDERAASVSTPPQEAGGAEALARRFHEAYERLAQSFGYMTRTETRNFTPDSPNGKLMLAVCAELLGAVAAPPSVDQGSSK